jgi:hypothetical protein
MVTSWIACPYLPLLKTNGLLCQWHQNTGTLFTAGISQYIRLWDAEKEVCVQVSEFKLGYNVRV